MALDTCLHFSAKKICSREASCRCRLESICTPEIVEAAVEPSGDGVSDAVGSVPPEAVVSEDDLIHVGPAHANLPRDLRLFRPGVDHGLFPFGDSVN